MTTLPPNHYPTPHQPPQYSLSGSINEYDNPLDFNAMQYPSMAASSSSSSVRSGSSATALQMGYMNGGISNTSPTEGSFGSHGSAPMQQQADGWWSGSGDSGNGSGRESTTPPSAPYAQKPHPTQQYHLPNNGDIFTPSHFVTPSTSQQNGFSSTGSGPSFTRPPLMTSASFPGSMFTNGEPLPNLVTPPSAGYPITMHNQGMYGQGYTTPGMLQNYHFGMPPPPPPHIVPGSAGHPMAQTRGLQMSFRQPPNGFSNAPMGMGISNDDWVGEWEDDEHPGEWYTGGMEVKHRRRTSPEQLKVLEHWFGINPKPDNALREWLAGELGMTKRNVQVWFQNRRAKIKGQQIKEKVAQEKAIKDSEGQKTPPGQITSSRPAPLLAPLPHPFPRELRERAEMELQLQAQGIPLQSSRNLTIPLPGPIPNGGRRVSLANGEAERIQMWAAKRVNGGATSPRSPTIGQAAAARRGSIPYPTPLSASFADGRNGGVSPKFSPSVRPMPSTLHLTAIRNNTRRASMPGPPQLISSGPFTPPRIVSAHYPLLSNATSGTTANNANNGRQTRELSPIKDTDTESGGNANGNGQSFTFSETDFSTTYLTPPSSTYNPSGNSTNSSISNTQLGDLQTPQNGPLPNPTYSFGANPMFATGQQTEEEAKRAQAIFMSIQERGRLGSLASIGTGGTWTTDGTSTVDETELGDIMFGFDQSRRASAPAELLENLGHLGIGSFGANGIPLRPSPLGTGNTSFTASEPLMQPPYVQSSQFSSQQPGQLRIPSVPEHLGTSPSSSHVPSPSDFLNPGSQFQASPIEMNSSGGLSAASMSAQSSMHSANGSGGSRHSISPAQTPFSQVSSHSGYAQTNSYPSHSQPVTTRSLSAGIPDWSPSNTFDVDDDMLNFSFAVPTMSVSAPASAYPGSQGETQSQQILLALADIPGSKGSSPRSASGGSQIGVGKGIVRTEVQVVVGEAE